MYQRINCNHSHKVRRNKIFGIAILKVVNRSNRKECLASRKDYCGILISGSISVGNDLRLCRKWPLWNAGV